MPRQRSYGKSYGEGKKAWQGARAHARGRAARPACLRKKIVTQHVSHQRQHFFGLVELLPCWHATKAVVDPVPNELGLVGARLELRGLARVGSGAVTVRALF